MSLECLFNPASIAFVGAAHTETKLGGVLLRNLLSFDGKVFPINPKYAELMGLKAYPSVAELPEPVDLTLIMRPAPEAPQILNELRDRTKCAVIISSGFAEVGESDLQDRVKEAAGAQGIRLMGPNCMGIFNPYRRLDTFFIPRERLRRPKRGNVAVVSQSGAVLHCLFEIVRDWNVGISKAVGYSNAVDIDEVDLYEYLASDRRTEVVVSYVESVGDGRRFIRAATDLTSKKPLLVLKSGKGTKGQAAAYSHTGRLAGRYEVFRSIMREFGVREVGDFDELMDATKALSYQRACPGNRVCIITNGGGSGVLAADECMRQSLDVADLPADKSERLKDLFPHFYAVHNPLDLTAQVRDEEFLTALDTLKDSYDGFLVIALAGVPGISERLGELIARFRRTSGKPIVLYTTLNPLGKRLKGYLERSGIPAFPSPERAVRGLRALLKRGVL
jgi:acyl-CoA synthetase (NDP forming)